MCDLQVTGHVLYSIIALIVSGIVIVMIILARSCICVVTSFTKGIMYLLYYILST